MYVEDQILEEMMTNIELIMPPKLLVEQLY